MKACKIAARRLRKRLGLLALLAVFFGFSCASRGAGDTRRELLGEWSTGLIVPLYAALGTQAGAVQERLQELCDAPDEQKLQAARDEWQNARISLKQAEVFAFGPYSRIQLGSLGATLDTWPAKVDRVEERIAGMDPITPAAMAQAGVSLRGSPVLGYLLHSTQPDALTGLQDVRRCEYLLSVAADFAERSQALADAWSPEGGNFAAELSTAGRTGTAFSSLRDAFGEIVNRMGFTLENIRNIKLGEPLGEKAGGTVQPELVESRFSGRSIADIEENLRGLQWLYFGDESRGFRGLDVYVKEQNADFDDEFRDGLSAIGSALDAIDGTLGEALVSQRSAVESISSEVGVLERLIQSDMIGALGLTVSFNDNDGD